MQSIHSVNVAKPAPALPLLSSAGPAASSSDNAASFSQMLRASSPPPSASSSTAAPTPAARPQAQEASAKAQPGPKPADDEAQEASSGPPPESKPESQASKSRRGQQERAQSTRQTEARGAAARQNIETNAKTKSAQAEKDSSSERATDLVDSAQTEELARPDAADDLTRALPAEILQRLQPQPEPAAAPAPTEAQATTTAANAAVLLAAAGATAPQGQQGAAPDAKASADVSKSRPKGPELGLNASSAITLPRETAGSLKPSDAAAISQAKTAADSVIDGKAAASFSSAMHSAMGDSLPAAPLAPALAAAAGNASLNSAGQPASTAPARLDIAAHLESPLFAPEMAARLSVLAADGLQQAELHLNPADMGPVSVQIVLDGQQAQVSFHAEHSETRAVLESSLPELAGALREQGLTLSGGGVFQQSAQQQRQQQAEAERQASRSGPDTAGAIVGSEQPVAAVTPHRQRGVLDLYA